MILDTEFLGNLQAGNETAREKAADMEDADVPIRIPTAVVWEIHYGIGKTTEEEGVRLQRAYRRLFASHPVVDLTDDIARRAGVLRGVHRSSDGKRTLDGADSPVAATALSLGEPVVSNDRDFLDVAGLAVETY